MQYNKYKGSFVHGLNCLGLVKQRYWFMEQEIRYPPKNDAFAQGPGDKISDTQKKAIAIFVFDWNILPLHVEYHSAPQLYLWYKMTKAN